MQHAQLQNNRHLLLWKDLGQVLLLGMLLFMCCTPGETRGCLKIANLTLVFDACETYCVEHVVA